MWYGIRDWCEFTLWVGLGRVFDREGWVGLNMWGLVVDLVEIKGLGRFDV